MNKKLSFAWLALATALVFAPGGASAETTKFLPNGGNVYIGQIFGDAWATVQNFNGACSFVLLGRGGLQDMTMVWAVDNASEYVTLVDSTQTRCGFSISPLVTNGWQLTVSTNNEGDSFYNAVTPNVRIYAGAGSDILINYTSTSGASIVAGGPGTDYVIGDANDYIVTEQDNDYICITNGKANTVDGGGGTDELCGSAMNETSITHRCPCRNLI